MPAVRLVPDRVTFERYLERGFTQREMVEEIERTTGFVVTRSAVAQALVRYGLADEKMRYEKHLPWKVRREHLNEYPARMLRLLGRRDTMGDLTEAQGKKLDSWLRKLNEQNAVIGYDPDSRWGFAAVPRKPGDGRKIPIRRELIRLPE